MRALHVFRDQTSLAASPELWPAIEKALSESEFLLLMASPAAAASHWVGREIEWWFANRPNGTMFILLTEGELVWDETASDFDWERTSSLPRAQLSGRLGGEPLWVDLRWAKSEDTLSLRNTRFRSAILDIAAPLHGKDKDALDGDDVRQFARMQRLRRAVIAGLSVLTVAAIGAAVVAVRQRDEATRQNVIAQAGRLAAQSDLLLESGVDTDVSVMLATEAMAMLDAIGERSAEVDLTLRRALADLPRSLREVELSSNQLVLDPGGAILSVEIAGGGVQARRLADGAAVGCAWNDIKTPIAGDTSGSVRVVKAISPDAAWCVVVQFNSSTRQLVERWTASPLRRVDQMTVALREGFLRPYISDDGDLLVLEENAQTGAKEQALLRLLRRSRNVELMQLTGEQFRGFSPDHRHFATTSGLWRLADSAAAAPERVIRWGGDTWYLVFSRSGSFVAVADDKVLEIWDVRSGVKLRGSKPPDATLLAIRDDGRFIAVALADTTRVLDALSDTVVAVLPLRADVAAFATRDPILIVESLASSARLWRVLEMPVSGTALAAIELPRDALVHSVAMHDNVVDVLFSADSTTRLSRWRVNSGLWHDVLTRPRATTVHVSANGRVFASSIGSVVTVGVVDGASSPVNIAQPGQPSLIALSHDGRYLATVVADTMHVFRLGTAAQWHIALSGAPSAIHVSTDGLFASALLVKDTPSRIGPEHELVRWSVRSPTQATSMILGRARQNLASTCMLSGDARFVTLDGKRFAFGDSSTHRALSAADLVECDRAFVQSLQLSATGSRLLVSDTTTATVIARLEQPAPIVRSAAQADGRRVATVDNQGGVRVFAIDAPSLVAQVCARAPRPLTATEWSRYMLAFMKRARRVDVCRRPIADSIP